MRAQLALATVTVTASILLAEAGAQIPADFVVTERDRMVQEIESWETVLEDWERRARNGSIRSEYEVEVVATFDPGEARFVPQPGGIYFYENVDRQSPFAHAPDPRPESKSSVIVVGDARSREVIAHYEFAPEMFASVHTTAMSPDGREMWATSNRESRIYVFDAGTREPLTLIDMPTTGGAHGLVWVHYDEDGNSRVVADQGGFHNGIDPRSGRPLEY